ncbi:DUF5590 domain-containing protein [Paenibacillus sp. HJGM_3]|uniref:cell wall elongation regulator TseB-like domain-containing protein n=1 Tax=Paenibacillus sp. HJGM_3 TaxID=3379816 RepID=UPI00385BF40A
MKKIIAGVIGLLIIAIILLSKFYIAVQNDQWTVQAQAAETVTQNTYISEVTRMESFRGEQAYTIVFGKDFAGKEGVAWVGDDEVHMEYLGDGGGVTEDYIRNLVSQKGGDVEIKRVLPGKLDGEYVWEVLYKRDDQDGSRFYYDYYRFLDGMPIDTWKLSKQ